MFSKMLAPYSIRQAGEVIRSLGFAGVDLTCRPQGHVLPEQTRERLPQAVRELRSLGLSVPMLTTGITSADDAHAADVFAAAAACGVRQLKLGYWRYSGFGQGRQQIREIRDKLRGIERLAKEHGVQACVHIHSGDYLSANPAVLMLLLEGTDPAAIGAYIDPGHMTVEGGVSGWKIGMDLLADRIALVAIKSFGWFREEAPSTGEVRWQEKLVPLREGTVRWREVFSLLRQIGYDGAVSVHSEYQGSHSWRDLTTEQLIDQTRDDVVYLRSVMAGS